jgi:hypothetical protein
MERRWLFLVRSYEFTERLTGFSDETKRQADKLPRIQRRGFSYLRPLFSCFETADSSLYIRLMRVRGTAIKVTR